MIRYILVDIQLLYLFKPLWLNWNGVRVIKHENSELLKVDTHWVGILVCF